MSEQTREEMLADIRRVMERRGIKPNPRLTKEGAFAVDPWVQVSNEAAAAISDLYRPAEDYHRLPWPELDALVGGMPGGEICYVVAFSSQGKTTFLTSLLDITYQTTKKKLYFMGLESHPKTLRTHWAAKRLGVDAGDLLSGEFLKWANWKEVREAVDAEIASQTRGDKLDRVRFSPTPEINARNLSRAADEAAEFGADIVVIDHQDQMDGSAGKSDYSQSVEVTRTVQRVTQKHGFLMMPSSQLNSEAVKGNRIALHLPPQPHYVKWGNHKREVATWMLGIYRPLRLAGVEQKEIRAFNTGQTKDTSAILEPNTMAVVAMKHRFYGNREWKKAYLRVEHGRVMDRYEQ